MTALSRRPPPSLPASGELTGPYAAGHILELWQAVIDMYDSLPAPHGNVHDADGSDPLTTPGTPRPIGFAAEVGTGPAPAYEDHVHDTPLTTNGDLLTVLGGILARRAVGAHANGEILTLVGGLPDWAPPAGGAGSANAVEASVDLGSTGGLIFGPFAVAAAWVTATTKLVCAALATADDGQTVETVAASGIQAFAANRSAGVGFDLYVYSPHGATGIFRIHCIGV